MYYYGSPEWTQDVIRDIEVQEKHLGKNLQIPLREIRMPDLYESLGRKDYLPHTGFLDLVDSYQS